MITWCTAPSTLSEAATPISSAEGLRSGWTPLRAPTDRTPYGSGLRQAICRHDHNLAAYEREGQFATLETEGIFTEKFPAPALESRHIRLLLSRDALQVLAVGDEARGNAMPGGR